ncbi:MAG: hypothetical protein LBL91_03110 [Lachnospiraceae bacterium]|jgi:hypothetical protein|nr:hypothetical protein [Lachnospiraceae bacterium]
MCQAKNYLKELYQDSNQDFYKDFEIKSRKDPDKSSKELYEDLLKAIFNKKTFPNGKNFIR